MRIPNRLRPQSRPPTPGEAAAGPGGRVRLFRLTHVVVVLTNVLQLVMMIKPRMHLPCMTCYDVTTTLAATALAWIGAARVY